MNIIQKIILILFITIKSVIGLSQDSTGFFYKQVDSLSKLFEYDKANDILYKSIRYKKTNQEFNLGTEYYKLALLYKKCGKYQTALNKADSSVFFFTHVKDKHSIAKANLLKGKIFNRLENYIDAINVIKESLIEFENVKDTFNIAVVKMNMGNIHKNMLNSEESIQFYKESITYFKQLKLDEKVADCYNNLGNTYSKINSLDSAKLYYDKTLEIRNKYNDQVSLSFLYHNYGNFYLSKKDYASALFYIKKSIKIKTNINNLSDLQSSYVVLGEIYMSLLDYKKAIMYLNMSLINTDGLYQQLNNDAHLLIAKCYNEINDFEKASFHFSKHFEINDYILKRKSSTSLEKQFIKYEIIKDSLSRSELEMQKELSVIERNNLKLESTINSNNILYLIFGLIGTFIFGAALYFSSKKRLKLSNKHKIILENQNEELKRTLISKEEKETLLKEIHHRVKNNLQIINSLIRLQSHYMSPQNYESRLIETENRIRSMALVHEKLYKSKDLSKLDAKSYIIDLSKNLIDAYEFKEKIEFDFDIEEIDLTIDSLIPFGLIINEVVSNSIKYAFTGLDGGVISISLKKDSKILLKIKDNGIGADLTFEELSSDSLGMELIETLCEQLDGEFYLEMDKGFTYTFEFKTLK